MIAECLKKTSAATQYICEQAIQCVVKTEAGEMDFELCAYLYDCLKDG